MQPQYDPARQGFLYNRKFQRNFLLYKKKQAALKPQTCLDHSSRFYLH